MGSRKAPPDSITGVFERVPGLEGLLDTIPGARKRLRQAFGRDALLSLPPTNRSVMTLLMYVAGLAERDRKLDRRSAAVERELADINRKAEIARAAEQTWQVRVPIADAIVLGNAAGEVAKLPLDFIRTLQSRRPMDATDIRAQGQEILVLDGKRTLVRMPLSLWVCLDQVLEACPWLYGDV